MIEFFPSREVVLIVFGLSIHWYGVLYVASFGLAIWLLPYLQKWRGLELSRRDWVEVVSIASVGVLVGGRLGYVLLYEPVSFWVQLEKIVAIWNGGMASHGGFVGVALVIWLYVKYALPKSLKSLDESRGSLYWRLMDILIVPVALGLFLGRVGNVINQELFATQMAQGLAVAKNLFIALICYWYLRSSVSKMGGTTALFLLSYGLLRFLIEYLRVQDHALVWGLTLGQVYTIPIIITGVILGFYVNINKTNANQN